MEEREKKKALKPKKEKPLTTINVSCCCYEHFGGVVFKFNVACRCAAVHVARKGT